jgi:UDP-N-acetylmuramoyl-L-alanyl-D-glutamate--2,6-diaminopimelate ligase
MTDDGPRPPARVSSEPVLPQRSPAPSVPPVALATIAARVADAELRGEGATSVIDAAFDSREARPGCLFFCVPGEHADGHAFAADAVAAGAVALVVERWLAHVDRPQVLVPSAREAMGPMSAGVFGEPASDMTVFGVTGTNGKTTITYLLEGVLETAGARSGVIGTTGARIGGAPVPLARTTPEAPDLHRLLATMRDAGVTAVAMEVSSHALDQHRVGGVNFDVAGFTNLSQDHLDYHGSMESYFEAKSRLFDPGHARLAVVNADDPWGRRLLEDPLVPTTSYGLDAPADLAGTDVVVDRDGGSFRVGDTAVRTTLRGRFNVSNCLGAIAMACAAGIDPAVAAAGVATVSGVPGRIEPVEAGQNFLVVVDYAHTPDSIHHVLQAARPLTSGRLIVVFGCGGDRDRAKRPLMGAAAAVADLSIITSDNPRSEDPMAIVGEIEVGARAAGGAVIVEPDRRAAIARAFAEAVQGDTVVIAGKGHEAYQELATGTVAFDDRVVARELLSGSAS